MEWIAVIIFVILIIIFYIVFKKILKAILMTLAVFFIILLTLTIFVVQDARDVQENFATSPKLLLLIDNGIVLTGFVSGTETSPVSADALPYYTEYLHDDDLDKIKSDYYKLILINYSAIADESVTIQGRTFTPDEIDQIFHDDQAASALGAPHTTRSILFTYLVDEHIFGGENAGTFLTLYRNDEVIIYEETLVFYIMKHVKIADPFLKKRL